jgi:hypothetical protein
MHGTDLSEEILLDESLDEGFAAPPEVMAVRRRADYGYRLRIKERFKITFVVCGHLTTSKNRLLAGNHDLNACKTKKKPSPPESIAKIAV